MSIKGFSILIWNRWDVYQKASLLWFELLECQSKGLSTLILNCWNVDRRTSLLWSILLPLKVKIWNQTLTDECFVVPLLLRCVIFIYPFSIWTLWRKVWLTKDSIFEKHLIFETGKFWNWYLKFWDFETLIFCIEIWNLKSKILRFRILKIKAWNFDHEIWGLNFFLKF